MQWENSIIRPFRQLGPSKLKSFFFFILICDLVYTKDAYVLVNDQSWCHVVEFNIVISVVTPLNQKQRMQFDSWRERRMNNEFGGCIYYMDKKALFECIQYKCGICSIFQRSITMSKLIFDLSCHSFLKFALQYSTIHLLL